MTQTSRQCKENGSCGMPQHLLATTILLLCLCPIYPVLASDSSSSVDTALYGNALTRDWLYNANAISIQVEGCVWGYVSNHDNANCMENGSSDGTTYWYQMANCRRAQVAYSMYATSNGNSASCNSNNFQESFITTSGIADFLSYVKEYNGNEQFDDDSNGGDDSYDEDDGGDNNADDYPSCKQSNNGYIGLGCTDEGKFALQYFSDAYCLTPTGKTYDKLNSFNRGLKQYKKCAGIGGAGNGNNDGGGSLAEQLIAVSASCSSSDSGYCTDSAAMSERRRKASSHYSKSSVNLQEKSWMTKLKYAVGGLLLLASFVMFTGILFTNRRRRRALMQRKYRQSRGDRSRKHRSSKSRSRKSSRSKSRAREKDDGYFA